MKKIILLVVALVFVNFAKAQQSVVKVNPLGIAFGVINATYEKALSESGALEIGASYFNWSSIGVSGLGGDVAYRFYFSKNNDAPEGIYAAPLVGVNSLTYKDDSNNETALFISLGAKAGYQWIFDSGLALDLYFGYGKYISGGFDDYSGFSAGRPILGVAVGYAF